MKQIVYAVPNPLHFAPLADISLPKSPATPKFTFVGRLAHDKGVDLLIRATASISRDTPKFEVLIIGDGPEMSALRELSKELGTQDRVQFLGRKSASEIGEILAASTALVYPSRWEDPAGYSPVEAAAQSTFTIAARVGGVPETAGTFALYFEREDFTQLANHMMESINNPYFSAERGRKARETAFQTYETDNAVRTLLRHLGVF